MRKRISFLIALCMAVSLLSGTAAAAGADEITLPVALAGAASAAEAFQVEGTAFTEHTGTVTNETEYAAVSGGASVTIPLPAITDEAAGEYEVRIRTAENSWNLFSVSLQVDAGPGFQNVLFPASGTGWNAAWHRFADTVTLTKDSRNVTVASSAAAGLEALCQQDIRLYEILFTRVADAAEKPQVGESGVTTIPAAARDRSSSGPSFQETPASAESVAVGWNTVLRYTVQAEKAGAYYLNLKGGATADANPEFHVNVAGSNESQSVVPAAAQGQNETVREGGAYLNLAAGENTIAVQYAKREPFQLTELTLEAKAAPGGEGTEGPFIVLGKEQTSKGGAVDDSAANYLGLNPGGWAEYTITGVKAGRYDLTLNLTSPAGTHPTEVTINSGTTRTYQFSSDTAWGDTGHDCVIGAVNLQDGTNTIKFQIPADQQTLCLFQFKLEKTTDSPVISADGVNVVQAARRDKTSVGPPFTGDGAVADFAANIPIQQGNRLDYTVQVAEAGRYALEVRGSSSAEAVLTVSADGEKLAQFLCGKGSSTVIGRKNLTLAAGDQTLQFEVQSGGFTFEAFTLTKLTGPAPAVPDIPAEGAAVIKAASRDDTSTGKDFSAAPADAEKITFDKGERLDYTVHVQSAGRYQLTVKGATAENAAASLLSAAVDGISLFQRATCATTDGPAEAASLLAKIIELGAGVQTLSFSIPDGPGFEFTEYTLEKTEAELEPSEGPFVVAGQSYTGKSDNLIIDREGFIGVPKGAWAEYKIQNMAAGTYQVQAKYSLDSVPRSIAVSMDEGAAQTVECTADGGWMEKTADLCAFTVTAGDHTLKFAAPPDAPDAYTYCLFNFTLTKAAGPGETVTEIAAAGSSTIPAMAYSALTGDAAQNQNLTGCVDIRPGGAAEYKINVAKAGSYKLAFTAASGNDTTAQAVYLDGTKAFDCACPTHPNVWDDMKNYQAGALTLTTGEHTLKLESTAGAITLKQIVLTAGETVDPTGQMITVPALDYKEYAGRVEAEHIALEGPKTNPNGTVTYEVDIPETGRYRLAMKTASGMAKGTRIEVYVGAAATPAATGTLNNKSWVDAYTDEIGVLELQAGKNLIRFDATEAETSSAFFEFTLTRIGGNVVTKPVISIGETPAQAANPGDTVKATVMVNNTTEAAVKPVIILAVYQNNVLVRIKTESAETAAGAQASLSAELTLPAEGGGTVKAMIFDSLDHIQPMAAYTEIPWGNQN